MPTTSDDGGKPMVFYTMADWRDWISAHEHERRNHLVPPTPKQLTTLTNLRVPAYVQQSLSRALATLVIGRRIEENRAYGRRCEAERNAKAVLLAERMRQEQLARADAELLARRVEAEREAAAKAKATPTDPATGLVGTPAQCQWAERIRTSLTPYLRKLRATALSGAEVRDVIDYALGITDARYWIAFRDADMGAERLDRLLRDTRNRRMLAKLGPAASGMVDWDEVVRCGDQLAEDEDDDPVPR